MKIFVNDTEVNVHQGAKVVDALRAYVTQQGQTLPSSWPVITDGYGNSVAPDGALKEGHHLYLSTAINNHGKQNRRQTTQRNSVSGVSNALRTVALLCAGLLFGCSTQPTAQVAEPAQVKTLEILAVNDMHAALDNFPRFAFIVDRLRDTYPDLLLVAAGDNQTGNPANDQYPQKGMPIIELMNALKFDLSAVGNHEFDSRLAGFEHITQQAEFEFLAANTVVPEGSDFRIKPYTVITTSNGLKVAFLSLLDINPNGIPDTHPDNVRGFTFKDPFQTAQDYLFLADSSDVFIMLNHMGFEEDVKLAQQLPANSVDVIIGGHSHTKVEQEQLHNGVLITQAERKLKYATLIQLGVHPDGRVEKSMQLLTVGKEGDSRADIQAKVDAYNNNPVLTQTIAIATDDFSSAEEIGYLMTDAIRAASATDIALINPGGVRIASLPKGPIRTKDVYEMDPFGNEIVVFNLTGHELRNLLLFAYGFDENKPIYPSGITTRYVLRADGSLREVLLFTAEGDPLPMDHTYSVVMNDYMATVYTYEYQDPGQGLFRPTAETTIDYLKQLKHIPSYRSVTRVELQQ